MLKLNVPFCAYACLYYERNRPVFKFKIMKVVGLDLSSSRHSDKPRQAAVERDTHCRRMPCPVHSVENGKKPDSDW